MPHVITADVVVEAKVPIVLAHVPVSRGHDTVHERTVVQYGQIEPGPIPADQSRRVMLHGLEKLLDQRSFGVTRLAGCADTKPVISPTAPAYAGGFLQMHGQEVVAHGLSTGGISALDHLVIWHFTPPVVERAQALDIGNRLEIKDQRWRHYR